MGKYRDIGLVKYDLIIENGDFKIIADSSQQESDLILNTSVGNWFQFPLCGVGLINFLAGNQSALSIESIIKNQMETDGFVIETINVNNSTFEKINIDITANRP